MPDVFTKRKRSEVMSRIRGRGNKDTEVALARILRKAHITGWRRQVELQIGGRRRARRSRPTTVRPDFIFPKQRVAVFVDGCFWHGCPMHSNPAKWIKKSEMGEGGERREHRTSNIQRPTSNQKSPELNEGASRTETTRTGKRFWWEKMLANRARDRFVNRTLRRQGWRVVRIWEHSLRKGANIQHLCFAPRACVAASQSRPTSNISFDELRTPSRVEGQRRTGSYQRAVEKIRGALERR